MHMHATIPRHRNCSFPGRLSRSPRRHWNANWRGNAAAMNGSCLRSQSGGISRNSGRPLKDRSGPGVLSMHPASIDTLSEHVDPMVASCRRAGETRPIATWQAGEPALTSFVNRTFPGSVRRSCSQQDNIGPCRDCQSEAPSGSASPRTWVMSYAPEGWPWPHKAALSAPLAKMRRSLAR